MKRRIFTAVLALTAALLLAVSCSQETGTSDAGYSTVLIKPVISDSKALEASSISPTRYTYTATQNFSSEGATSDLGGTSVEKDLTKGSGDSYATADRFAQGKWTFTVKGYREVSENPEEDVFVYEGTVTVYLSQSVHTVVVPMSAQFSSDSSVKGSVTVSPTSIRLNNSSNLGKFKVGILGLDGSELTTYAQEFDAVADTSGSQDNVTGTKTFQLPEGQYIMTIRYESGSDSLGPAQVAIKVKNGITTTVTGKVESGAFTSPDIEMVYLGGTLSKSSSADSNGDYTFTFTANGVTSNLVYRWYINGALQTTPSVNPHVFKYGNNVDDGVYYVTCVVSTGSGTSGDIFSDTQVLYLN